MSRCFLLKLIQLILKAHYNLSRRDNAMVAVRLTRDLYLFPNRSAAVPLVTNKLTLPPLRQRRI
jgi:hypothetical protein